MKKNIKSLISDNPLLAILIFAGIIRTIFILLYYYNELWDQLLVDSLFHNYWAQSIANGNILGSEAFFRAPFYIYILGGIYAIFDNSILAARIFGAMIGISSVYITGKIAFRLFGRKTAIIAALLHAVYPIAIYFESELLVDTLFTFLFELSILCFLIAEKTRATKWFILTGCLIGLASITKPTILALLPVYIIWLFLRKGGLSKSINHSIILIAFSILVILPVTIRNLLVADDFVMVSSSGGINFYIGNNADADGSTASMPPPLGHNWQIKDINYLAENETGRKLKASEVSDFWFAKAIDWITTNKIDFMKLYIHKLYLSVNNLEISNNRDLTLFFSKITILKSIPVNFSLILALVSISLFFLLIKKEMNLQILFILIITFSYLLIISLFFINARFRLPVLPLMIVLASYGLSNLISIDKKATTLKTHSIAIVIGMGVFLLSFIPPANMTAKEISAGYFNQANFYLYKGDYSRATDLYNKLLNSNPHFPDANLNLGVAYLRLGNGDSAEYYFKKEIELFPGRADGYANLASIYLINNNYLTSMRYADSALALEPYHTEAILIKMRNQTILNDSLGLQNTINEALAASTAEARIYLEAGLIYSSWSLFDKALNNLTSALSAEIVSAETDDRAFTYSGLTGPQMSEKIRGQAAYQLGFIYGRQNDLQKSIEFSNLAILNDSSLADAYVNLINGYYLSGQRDSARSISLIALDKFPDHQTIRAISTAIQ